MTAALHDLHPDAGHPVLAGLAVIENALEQLLLGTATPLSSGDYTGVLRRIERIRRRTDAVRLKLIAAADKAGAPNNAGFTGTEAWAASQTQTSRTTASREVRLARDLDTGGHDTTAAALDAGLVSPDQAEVILKATETLPEGVSDTQRQQVETALVEKAQRFNPDQLRRAARRAIEEIEPDEKIVDAREDEQLRAEEEIAREKSRLTFHDNGDGTTTGHFTVPTTAVAHLRKIIEAMTSPRRMRQPSGSHDTGAGAPTNAQRDGGRQDRFYDWDHRRGVAFTELLEHLPTDHLHDKTAATVVVTISHEVLQGALKAAHLDTGQALSAGEARRLACNAGIIPAVLGTGSVALDLGHETRLFSQAQRVAVGLRHDTCAAEGCERPYAWCELHHREPWRLGGRTDLRNAVPLCHWHHQRIHDPGFCHRYQPDGSIAFSRRT